MKNIGFKFENTYAKLPDILVTKLVPVPVKKPKLIIFNNRLAKDLGLDVNSVTEDDLTNLFSGNKLPAGSEPLAQAYCGHQFGHFVMLGDGRAIVLGEHLTPSGKRIDIQFKGSGRTPYSRSGDGRAALGPMLREYIISEAMHGLKIPTTRSLAVVATGEMVQREVALQGAVLTRVASSHLRVGTFQYLAARQDIKSLKELVSYTIKRHYPEFINSKNQALELLRIVIKKQAYLIAEWMRVSFIHGVMNTDNMTISGETIDYGPCAFMDYYDPKTVFSSIDLHGRYAFGNQPNIAEWNLARFA
ncbi:MAG: protein adenylyltransferase SelO, partial [Pelagibacteraceae bacterium]